jgi:hypothetical protein
MAYGGSGRPGPLVAAGISLNKGA